MIGSYVNFKSANGATDYKINDRYSQPLLWHTSPFYYISLDSVDGLYGADISYESHPIPNSIGESSGDVIRRGKTITLTGTIQAKSYGALQSGAEFLWHMFAETSKRKLLWKRWVDLTEIYLICRVSQDLVITENVTGYSPRFQYVVGLRADDPRTYKSSDNTVYPTWQA